MKLLTFFNLVRTLQSHPEILKRVLNRMREQDRLGFDTALLLVRQTMAQLLAEMDIRGAVAVEIDTAIAAWGD